MYGSQEKFFSTSSDLPFTGLYMTTYKAGLIYICLQVAQWPGKFVQN